MTVIHVDFMHSRSEVSAPLDYRIDFHTGTLSFVDSWERIRTIDRMINDRLTFKQFTASRMDKNGQAVSRYSDAFARILKVTKKRDVVRLATEGLEMIARLEAQASKSQASN